MSDPIEQAKRALEHAELDKAYTEAVEAYRDKPTDARKAKKDELAVRLADVRTAYRQERETQAQEVAPGDGVARPAPVHAPSGVNRKAE